MSVCLSVRLCVRLSPVKFVKSFAKWRHLAASGAYRIDSDAPVRLEEIVTKLETNKQSYKQATKNNTSSLDEVIKS